MTSRRSPLEVLLVEDDEGDVLMVREALAEVRARTVLHVVGDGADALAFLRREPPHASAPVPDLVLLDLNLPGIGGLEVLESVKSEPGLRRIPIVVFTTSRSSREVRESYERHANAFITKPSSYEEFARAVQEIDRFFDELVTLSES